MNGQKLRVLDLFSGIGGFSLGLERAGGFETVAFCEIDPYCRKVLAKHWSEVKQYDDVRTLTADTLRRDGIAVDVICGGFPCQDLSFAGKRAGISGARSGLWGEYARLIAELRPKWVIAENVPGLLSGGDTIELPPGRCVCGWDVGWGGLHLDAGEEGLQLDPSESGHWDGVERSSGSAKAAKRVRRQNTQDARKDREVGRSPCADAHGAGVAPVLNGGSPVSCLEEAASGFGAVASGHDRRTGECNVGQEEVDAGSYEGCGHHQGSVARSEPEGAEYARTLAGMDCPSCGRDLGYSTGRSYYASWLGGVYRDLATLGYDACWECIPASAVGAPHRRDRWWLVAYAERDLLRKQSGWRRRPRRTSASQLGEHGAQQSMADAARQLLNRCGTGAEQAGWREPSDGSWWLAEPDVGRVADGVPARVHRLMALGNAVVPQIPELIGKAIMEATPDDH